jgi:hypothetical protein
VCPAKLAHYQHAGHTPGPVLAACVVAGLLPPAGALGLSALLRRDLAAATGDPASGR